MVRNILFDYYGVFQPDTYTNWLEINGLKRTGDFDRLAKELDMGKINHDELILRLSKLLKREVTYKEIYEQNLPINEHMVQIVTILKSKYRIGLLSNASTKLRSILLENNIYHLFDSITISSEIEAVKPEPAAYHAALQSLNAKSNETFYIDDNQTFVEAGKEVGLRAFTFTTHEKLLQDFASAGVTIN